VSTKCLRYFGLWGGIRVVIWGYNFSEKWEAKEAGEKKKARYYTPLVLRIKGRNIYQSGSLLRKVTLKRKRKQKR